MASYEDLAKDVIAWSNRDTSVLDYKRVRQCISFAMDEALRTLRIVPMEKTVTSTIGEEGSDDNKLEIPSDAIEFIQLRRIQAGAFGREIPSDRYDVAEARLDIRSYYGDNVTAYSDYAYSREGDSLLIWPRIEGGDTWELYYYARFPEAEARIAVTASDVAAGFVEGPFTDAEITAMAEFDPLDPSATPLVPKFDVYQNDTLASVTNWDARTAYAVNDVVIFELTPYTVITAVAAPAEGDPDNTAPSADDASYSADTAFDEIDTALIASGQLEAGDAVLNFIGELDDNWLRDENEKILLFGALHQAFDYLDEQDQSQKFKAKFEQEIQKLNMEDTMRNALGGNANINFYNRLI